MPKKQKQKQRQKQTQNVVVNIQEKRPKKRKPNRKKKSALPPSQPLVLGLPKVPPIVVQYTEPASLGQPPPPKSAAVLAAEPVKPKVFNEPRKVMQEPDWVKPVAKAPVPMNNKGLGAESVRPSSDVLKGAPPSLAEIIGRQTREPQLPAQYAPVSASSGGGASRPRSHGTEISVDRLQAGDYGETAGGRKRTGPTSAQKKILEKSGFSGPPWK
jgi:hypothetical protein